MNPLLRYAPTMRSLSACLALLALAALVPGAARAQQITTTKVTFSVTDPNGAAIPNARILVSWGTTFGLMATDMNGQLSVDMKGGRYSLPVSAPGYISDHVYVDLTSAAGPASATKRVSVVLVQAQEIATTTVTIGVTDPNGASIPNARIGVASPTELAVVATDEHGHASLKLQPGRYRLPVSAPGYKTAAVQIDLTSVAGQSNTTKIVTAVLVPDLSSSQTAIAPKDSLVVKGDAHAAPLKLSLAEFRALPHVDVKVHNGHTNADETYSGVPLAVLLATVDAPLGEKLRGKALTNYVVATGSDGYSVVLSLAEVDPSFHDGQIVVADARDGQPLTTSGPYQLIVSEDKRPARWVKNLITISVASTH